MRLRQQKFTVICPDCKEKRVIGYGNFWLINTKRSTGKCLKCANQKIGITSFKKDSIPWNKGLKGYLGGKNSPHWKGGITSLNMKIRNSLKYKEWRIGVFERDNYTCQICAKKEGETVVLNADHIKPFAYYPKLRFDLENGRTLCVNCHRQTDNFAGKAVASCACV